MSRDGDRDQARDGVHDTRTGPGPARARPASAPPASPTPGSARPAPSLRRSGRGGPGPGCSSSADTSSWTGSGPGRACVIPGPLNGITGPGPGRACAMRAQRDAVHPASHRASPARRNPPRLDSCEPASHNASRGDITNSTPPGGRGSGDADGDVVVAVDRLPPGGGGGAQAVPAVPVTPSTDSPGSGSAHWEAGASVTALRTSPGARRSVRRRAGPRGRVTCPRRRRPPR